MSVPVVEQRTRSAQGHWNIPHLWGRRRLCVSGAAPQKRSHTLLTIIMGALLPIVVVLLLGFFSGLHKDFTGDQATILNRMVMLYALPLLLFGSTVSISRSRLLSNVPLAIAVALGMISSFFVVLLVARFLFHCDLGTSALHSSHDWWTGGPVHWRVRSRLCIWPGKRIDPCHQCQPGNESRAGTCLTHTSIGGRHTERRHEGGQTILTFSCNRCRPGAYCLGTDSRHDPCHQRHKTSRGRLLKSSLACARLSPRCGRCGRLLRHRKSLVQGPCRTLGHAADCP